MAEGCLVEAMSLEAFDVAGERSEAHVALGRGLWGRGEVTLLRALGARGARG